MGTFLGIWVPFLYFGGSRAISPWPIGPRTLGPWTLSLGTLSPKDLGAICQQYHALKKERDLIIFRNFPNTLYQFPKYFLVCPNHSLRCSNMFDKYGDVISDQFDHLKVIDFMFSYQKVFEEFEMLSNLIVKRSNALGDILEDFHTCRH